MTLRDLIKGKRIPEIVKRVARRENVTADYLVTGASSGKIVIPFNAARRKKNSKNFKACAIGEGLKTKINANIGTSPDGISLEREIEKLKTAIDAGADTVMDLSTGGNLRKIRETIVGYSTVPVGTVPVYQAVCETVSSGGQIRDMDAERLFSVIEEHAASGVDFITVHCGITKKTIKALISKKRTCGIVSRGGAFLAEWILENGRENPLFENYDRLLDIASRYDVTLSLGDGMRPGSISDANDGAQISELEILAGLVREARSRNVQVIVEGPGHMPLNSIREHVEYEKKITDGAPFYVLGPITTDVAPGYDHITSAIGGAVAAAAGADFLCYVTPAEHIHLPDKDDVREGVMAARLAAHSGDIAKGVEGAGDWDREFSRFRVKLEWEKQRKKSLDPVKFAQERARFRAQDKGVCTMCGPYCAMRLMNRVTGCV